MGCIPSPLIAIIRIYHVERSSIYTDTHYLSRYVDLYYARYVDDISSLAEVQEEAQSVVQSVADEDPDKRIQCTLDFPDNPIQFTPFLSTEIRIDDDGSLCTRYYKKEHVKGLTLHQRSAHPKNTKIATVKNYYTTAIDASSGPEELKHSLTIVDKLLTNNGYENPRKIAMSTNKSNKRKRKKYKK